MDLRSIINTEAGENSIPKQAAPVTPIQAPPHHGFREYSHSSQPSPGKYPSQDYTSQTPGPYASPSTYQSATPYPGRPPPPPPIQAPPQNDLRSPVRSYSAQSPYQRTPSTSTSSQYPFPHTQTPQSPAQHQQYPPSFPTRDSYPQANPPPHHSQQNSLSHQNSAHNLVSPTPQTPPIGIPGAPHPYLQHQRSQSSISASTPTPTSAQSQQPYYPQYPQDSPVSAGPGPQFATSQIPQHHRQQSQPGTPLGPPLTQRPSSGTFPQPSSPYQQRGISTGPFSHFQQTSPAPSASATLPRHPSTPSAYDSQRTSLSEQRRSRSERERTLSVSPKTRVPSTPRAELPISQPENGYPYSTKRKMDDRDLRVEDHAVQPPESKRVMNGEHKIIHSASSSPKAPAKKRIRYTEIPIWAQSVRSKAALEIGQRAKLNGKQAETIPAQGPAQASVIAHSETNGSHNSSPMISRAGIQDLPPDPSILLGPHEMSLLKDPPTKGMTKAVADFFYSEVVSRNDFGELSSRGVEIEIEAKLGHLIDRATNHRYQLPILSECVLAPNPNIAFKSSMTLPQHSGLNRFLNVQVEATHPSKPKNRPRVPINYLHRRETDRFYTLPASMHSILPAAVREQIKRDVSVRVTTDQKTGQIIARIIKTRIADLDIYCPQLPLDCRISINFEMKFDGDIDEIIRNAPAGEKRPERQKDRLSYTQGLYQFDLTQVTSEITAPNGTIRIEREHELEIEVSTAAIRQQGQRAANGEPHEYPSLVEGLLNNVCLLSKCAGEQPPQ
ncbi:CYTH-like phosphatase [Glarea lozoyensis ATCC 20868]|uniref:mRNA-capping enzyme subunit beta n=1 Tax=Glarea lozoyensis (strain ATCC 20868 / MF5171) TaxID=1116229 RepID=S3DPH1_GLAL2|nr:CYTH-like phosphatase [Glarea lozoyensis ATCC 20868]EPE33996.1 CYTH-like phosphatase [Glarea lozoyensis ATCC 20868]